MPDKILEVWGFRTSKYTVLILDRAHSLWLKIEIVCMYFFLLTMKTYTVLTASISPGADAQ